MLDISLLKGLLLGADVVLGAVASLEGVVLARRVEMDELAFMKAFVVDQILERAVVGD